MDVVATVEQFTYFAIDETGLGRVEIDILESFDNLWGHGSTFLQGMRSRLPAKSPENRWRVYPAIERLRVSSGLHRISPSNRA